MEEQQQFGFVYFSPSSYTSYKANHAFFSDANGIFSLHEPIIKCEILVNTLTK